jgi:hypothetical protein
MEAMEHLGYEVRVYARVPDLGDGADRLVKAEREREKELMKNFRKKGANRDSSAMAAANTRKVSGTGATESDPGASGKLLVGGSKEKGGGGHSRSSSLTVTISGGSGNTSAPNGNPSSSSTRIRYREQGVDELLQLKLHQAIADIDIPPPGATIVLATGDGNVGQFNEEGFRGCVRTALKKGWRVELVAWEYGLSKSWAREFGGEERFKVIGLEKFAQDLLEIN